MEYTTLENISDKGFFKDGDWIESKDQDPDGNVRLLQLADIGVGEFINKSSKFINEVTFENLKCNEIFDGDILIARMPDPIGRACIFRLNDNLRYITAVDVAILRVNSNVSNSFVCYMLNSPSLLGESLKQCTGATRKRISRKKLAKFKIPLPPLPTQKKIASILDEADSLRNLNKKLIEKYDALTQSLFLDMFGDPVTNPMGWEKVKLEEFGNIITGNTPSRKDSGNFNSEFIEWIKTDNIKNSLFVTKAKEYLSEQGYNKSRFAKEFSLLVCCIAGSVESIGRAAINDRKVAFNQQINAIEPNKDVSIMYLYFLFKNSSKYIQNHASNGMKRMLSKGNFSVIEMIKPPIQLQNQFAERVALIEQQKTQAQQSLQKSEDLFNSLLQKAFKGELIK